MYRLFKPLHSLLAWLLAFLLNSAFIAVLMPFFVSHCVLYFLLYGHRYDNHRKAGRPYPKHFFHLCTATNQEHLFTAPL